MFKGGKPSQRYVPGANSVPGAPASPAAEEKKKRVRSKRPMKEKEKDAAGGASTTAGEANGDGVATPPVEEMSAVAIPDGAGDEALAKKLRNLAKKVSPPFIPLHLHEQ